MSLDIMGLTVAAVHYFKKLIPEASYTLILPPLSVFFGIIFTLIRDGEFSWKAIGEGFLSGFTATGLYGAGKQIVGTDTPAS